MTKTAKCPSCGHCFDVAVVDDGYGCTCAPGARDEVVRDACTHFYKQTGCLTCDRMDGPPRGRPRILSSDELEKENAERRG